MTLAAKTLALPFLALLSVLGLLAAAAFVWFLLPEARPGMRRAIATAVASLRRTRVA